MAEVVARRVKFVRWQQDRIVEQVRAVCIDDPKTGCWLWAYRGNEREWYPEVMINRRRYHVSRLILEARTGEVGDVARHRCDRPRCCNPDHLEWGTPQDNSNDMVERGRHRPGGNPSTVRGENHGLHKLTEDNVREMRALFAQGVSAYRLGKQFGVTKRTATQVTRRITWQHI